MILQILKVTSCSPAMHVGLAAALVCVLSATSARAGVQGLGFDKPRYEFDDVLTPTARHPLSAGIVLAQFVDNCGCDDANDYDDEFEEGFMEGFEEDFGEDYADEYADDYDQNHTESDNHGYATNQRLTPEERLNRITGRVLGVRERAIDVQSQGSYDYYGPAQ
ncbi:MAG: hypothetical protein ACR2QH_05240 [Geminicoccaceae bacterium]